MANPVLYSFRRCPYAMRTRMALQVSNQHCELREVVLRDKPTEMIQASPKATVPVLVNPDGTVLEESLEIMQWTLAKNDPQQWLVPERGDLAEMLALIEQLDGAFKEHLDRYKYATRYTDENGGDGVDPITHRDAAMTVLMDLNTRLDQQEWLFGNRMSLADVCIAPFVRQFANTDRAWFDAQPCKPLQNWLNRFLESALFSAVMKKYKPWVSGQPGVPFPEALPAPLPD
jgi:glutathione S-transferase